MENLNPQQCFAGDIQDPKGINMDKIAFYAMTLRLKVKVTGQNHYIGVKGGPE